MQNVVNTEPWNLELLTQLTCFIFLIIMAEMLWSYRKCPKIQVWRRLEFTIYGFEAGIILEFLKITYFTLEGYPGFRQQLGEFNKRLKEVSYLEGHFKTGKDWKGSRKGNMN